MIAAATVRTGLAENLAQFALLVFVNALVGAMIGMERAILPPIASQVFHLEAHSAILSFIAVFGVSKALANRAAGRWADRVGRRPVLLAGWALALPVPLLLATAPGWGQVLTANALLGLSQGLAWSATVIMKIDLAGPRQRGLAMGLNEAAGYLAVAGAAALTGWIAGRAGLGTWIFLIGYAFALPGLALSVWAVRETIGHSRSEAAQVGAPESGARPPDLFWRVTLRDRTLSTVTQAGLVNNLNDGMAWGLFPAVFASAGVGLEAAGWLVALYPATWGLLQAGAGALSDRAGRRWMIAGGMAIQAAGIWVVAAAGQTAAPVAWFASGQALLGLGTAMVYPTLLAVIGDVAHPGWRAEAVGVYRLWRDLGYAVGALLAGWAADRLGLHVAVALVGALTLASGGFAAIRLRDQTPRSGSVTAR